VAEVRILNLTAGEDGSQALVSAVRRRASSGKAQIAEISRLGNGFASITDGLEFRSGEAGSPLACGGKRSESWHMRDPAPLVREEIIARADRARQALLAAVSRVDGERFELDANGEWSAGRLLRHVVWVEHFWTLMLEYVRDNPGTLVEINETTSYELAMQASRLTSTPEQPLDAPPPYATVQEALAGLAESREHFLQALGATEAEHFEKTMAAARGVVSFGFAAEHIIEHDWDHAVHMSAMRP
jgi:hypothetical protein